MLYDIFIDPFVQMYDMPDFFLQVLWEGFVAGILYALIALGFVLIFKASGVFNFAQGIMVVFAGLTLVGLHENGVPAYLALALTIGAMGILAYGVERVVMRPLVNQPDIILLMATIGLTYFLIGFGEFVFGGEPKQMITEELGLPTGSTAFEFGDRGLIILQHIDIAAAVIAVLMVAALGIFFNKTRIGRALRAVADDHQAALSVGISLNQIWAIVWFAAGLVALATGIMWGARADVSFALEIVAFKALPVLILGGFTSIPGAIVGGLIIGFGEKIGELYWGGLVGGGVRELARVYGGLSALWRAPLLSLLERQIEPGPLLMDGIFVSEAARGHGVGTALLEAIKTHATHNGLFAVRLDVIDTNPRAKALYLRHGFEPAGEEHLGPFRHIFGFKSSTKMIWPAPTQ